jgi:HlyD family secretion protein
VQPRLSSFRLTRSQTWSLVFLLLGIIAITSLVSLFRQADPVDVHVATPTYQDLTTSVSTNGRIVPIDDFQARAAFAGTVEKIFVRVGEQVHAGQMLVKMKDPFAASRYASANAALQGARLGDQNIHDGGSQEDLINFRNDLEHARQEQSEATSQLATLKELQARGSASPSEVTAAEHRLEAATISLQTIQQRSSSRYNQKDVAASTARLADARASLDTAAIVLANANITSPIAGTVYSLPVSAYDFVNMGAELLRVADLTKVQVRAFFDEPDIGQLRAGQAVDIAWDARPNRTWHGHILQPPLTVNTLGTRSVGQCLINVDDADGDLLPNTNVTVTVNLDRRQHVLSIPHEALHEAGASRFVFRVVNGHLVRTPVQVGLINLKSVQVTGGVSDRDTIALNTTTNQELTNNLRVRVAP